MSRLTQGETPEDAINERLLPEYAIAGTPEKCLAQAVLYAATGVTELAIAPIGEHPADDIAGSGARSSSRAGHDDALTRAPRSTFLSPRTRARRLLRQGFVIVRLVTRASVLCAKRMP